MQTINTRAELVQLAKDLGVRPDWHEPDEQGITAEVRGTLHNFDNAMGPGEFYGHPRPTQSELHVVLRDLDYVQGQLVAGGEIAVINLATLFAWATGYEGDTRGHPNPQDPKELARKVRDFGERVATASREGQNEIVGWIVSDIVTRVVSELAKQIETGKL
jgi:hypothetical protein